MLHAIIMAGGSGTRFWPASRADMPKQLLTLLAERSMIQMTADRLGDLVPSERLLIVTGARLAESIAEQLPELVPSAILAEPCKRDTAPCIGLAAIAVTRNDAQATMVVMPSDHVIRPDDVFQQAIQQAADLVEESPQRIVTFGIRTSYPAETFGYIERAEPLAKSVYRVARFREKPDATTAQQYVDAGNFYWNSGIFVWKAQTILDALARHQPEMYSHLEKIAAAWDSADFDVVFQREFTAIRGVSIDYAVMEHAQDIVVIEAPFEWDDLGSWQSLTRLRGTDATLVANKHDEESIRQVVKMLQDKGWTEYL